MSDFMNALIDFLPAHNSLKNPNNELRIVLEKSLGEWFDNRKIQDFYDNLFLNTAKGKWLDLHGRDYGVYRKPDETDDAYRERIIQEKNDFLTPEYLETLYGVKVYVFVDDFDAENNTLTSDNPYINTEGYMFEGSEDVQGILNKKFILGDDVTWL